MELQWPLIIFSTLLAASAGVVGIQSLYAALGKGKKGQMPAVIIAFVLMVIGGIAVFTHLQHWERIFNGFGHITSGITQELIGVVVLFVVMLLIVIQVRRNGEVAKWLGIVGVIVALAMVFVIGESYMMPARPAWDSAWQILSLYGLALSAGAGIFALVDSDEADYCYHGIITIVATVIAAITTGAFIKAMASSVDTYTNVGYYFDPNHPTVAVANAANYGPFAEGAAALTIAAIVLAVLAIVFAVIGKLTKKWVIAGIGIAVCAIVAGLLLRAVFFSCGGSMFMFFAHVL